MKIMSDEGPCERCDRQVIVCMGFCRECTRWLEANADRSNWWEPSVDVPGTPPLKDPPKHSEPPEGLDFYMRQDGWQSKN